MPTFDHKWEFLIKNYLTPKERKDLQKLDDMVLNATSDELKKIQEIDHQTQLEGVSFFDVYLDSRSLIQKNIKKQSRNAW